MNERIEADRTPEMGSANVKAELVVFLRGVNAGDLVAGPELAVLAKLLPDDAMTAHLVDRDGVVCLLVSVPETQLEAFGDSDWSLEFRIESAGSAAIVLIFGTDELLECPFRFQTDDPREAVSLLGLARAREAPLYAFTHTEEGLVLTVKGTVELPAGLRTEIALGSGGKIR